MLWTNTRANDFIYTPLTDRESLQLRNKVATALVLDLPRHCGDAWDSSMSVHHQLWKKSSSQEPRVVQQWLRMWGWLPRMWGDPCFASFTLVSAMSDDA